MKTSRRVLVISYVCSISVIFLAALASSSAWSGFQGLPWSTGCSLSSRRQPVGLWWRSSSAAFCHIKDVCCHTDLQQLWRQVFCSCRSEAVEQPSSWSATSWHKLSTIETPTKDIFVRVLISRHIVTNCCSSSILKWQTLFNTIVKLTELPISQTMSACDLQCKDTVFTSESFLTILKTSDNADELKAVREKINVDISRLRSRDTGDEDGMTLSPLTVTVLQYYFSSGIHFCSFVLVFFFFAPPVINSRGLKN